MPRKREAARAAIGITNVNGHHATMTASCTASYFSGSARGSQSTQRCCLSATMTLWRIWRGQPCSVLAGRDGAARIIGAWLAADVDAAPLEAAGFERGWEPRWMAVELAAIPACTDDRVSLTTDVPEYGPDGQRLLALGQGPDATAWHAVARVDGAFAGRAWSFASGPHAGVFDMDVWPGFRRRGLGRALLRAVCSAARTAGAQFATLNATGDGEPLRQRGLRARRYGHDVVAPPALSRPGGSGKLRAWRLRGRIPGLSGQAGCRHFPGEARRAGRGSGRGRSSQAGAAARRETAALGVRAASRMGSSTTSGDRADGQWPQSMTASSRAARPSCGGEPATWSLLSTAIAQAHPSRAIGVDAERSREFLELAGRVSAVLGEQCPEGEIVCRVADPRPRVDRAVAVSAEQKVRRNGVAVQQHRSLRYERG